MPGRTPILAGAGVAALAVLGLALYGSGLLPGNMGGALLQGWIGSFQFGS